MAFAKLVCISLCWQAAQMSLAAVVQDSAENCSALPENDVNEGQRALLQHSELHRVAASENIQTHRAIDEYTLVGNGQCVDADGGTEFFQLGWAPCTCGKTLGSICVSGSCSDLSTCAAECDAVGDCAALNWYPGHCWLYGYRTKPYLAKNTEFSHMQCYIKNSINPTTTTTTPFPGQWVLGAEGQHCSDACNQQMGGICNEDVLQAPETMADTNALATKLGKPCLSYRDLPVSYSPALNAAVQGQLTCMWTLSKIEPRNCGAVPDAPYQRLCACNP